jgi:hypothetical protein
LDLSNSRELSGEVLRVLDQVVSVFVEFSERLAHFFKLVASHGRSIAFQFADFSSNVSKPLVQSKALVGSAALGGWHRVFSPIGERRKSHRSNQCGMFNDAETMGKFRRA